MEVNFTTDTLNYMYRYLLKYVGTYRVKSEYDYKSSSYDDDLDLLENLRASLDATSKSIIKIKS